MDDNKLEISLQRIGKACFVNYYATFRDKSRKDAIDFLRTKFTEAGANLRVGYARGIFDAGRQNDALKIIAKAAGVCLEIRDKARLLLNGSIVPPPSPRPAPPISSPITNRLRGTDHPSEKARSGAGASKEGSLVYAILREGIWFPPNLLDALPLLRPYAIRDNGCRSRGAARTSGDYRIRKGSSATTTL